MKSLKGQAAVEYLMNYSWAILILAIVIGAMLFSGVFNPSYYVIEECYLGPSFACHAQMISDQGGGTLLLINVTNRLSHPIKLKNITFSAENLGNRSVTFTDLNMSSGDSEVANVTFTGPGQPTRETVKKVFMDLAYYVCAEEVNPACAATPPFLRSVSGRIVTKVQ